MLVAIIFIVDIGNRKKNERTMGREVSSKNGGRLCI